MTRIPLISTTKPICLEPIILSSQLQLHQILSCCFLLSPEDSFIWNLLMLMYFYLNRVYLAPTIRRLMLLHFYYIVIRSNLLTTLPQETTLLNQLDLISWAQLANLLVQSLNSPTKTKKQFLLWYKLQDSFLSL
jgi:hypothetical protein